MSPLYTNYISGHYCASDPRPASDSPTTASMQKKRASPQNTDKLDLARDWHDNYSNKMNFDQYRAGVKVGPSPTSATAVEEDPPSCNWRTLGVVQCIT